MPDSHKLQQFFDDQNEPKNLDGNLDLEQN